MIDHSLNKLSEKYQIRNASWADVKAIVDLRNASSQSTRGTDSDRRSLAKKTVVRIQV